MMHHLVDTPDRKHCIDQLHILVVGLQMVHKSVCWMWKSTWCRVWQCQKFQHISLAGICEIMKLHKGWLWSHVSQLVSQERVVVSHLVELCTLELLSCREVGLLLWYQTFRIWSITGRIRPARWFMWFILNLAVTSALAKGIIAFVLGRLIF